MRPLIRKTEELRWDDESVKARLADPVVRHILRMVRDEMIGRAIDARRGFFSNVQLETLHDVFDRLLVKGVVDRETGMTDREMGDVEEADPNKEMGS